MQQEKPSLTLGPQGLALLVNKQVNSQIEVNKHAPGYVILPTINVSRGTQAKTSPKEEVIALAHWSQQDPSSPTPSGKAALQLGGLQWGEEARPAGRRQHHG